MKVFFVVSGLKGDEEKVLLVKEEEKETMMSKLDKVFFSHIYSVQSADMKREACKREENIPIKSGLPDNLMGNKQTWMNNFIDFKSNLAVFDAKSTASTSSKSSKPNSSKPNNSNQFSMNRFVYKKQNPPANSEWLNKLGLEFEKLESKESLELEEVIEDNSTGFNADNFQGVDLEDTDMSDRLKGIVCNWTDDDFEENEEVEKNSPRVAMSEPDGMVFKVVVDIIDDVMDIVSKNESRDPTEMYEHLEVSSNCFPSKKHAFEGELLEDIVSDWDIDDFEGNESDCLDMKWKKRKVCEDGIFEEDDEFRRRLSRVTMPEPDGMVFRMVVDIVDDVMDIVLKNESFDPTEEYEHLEVSSNCFPLKKHAFEGELLEDIVSDWDIDDFEGNESDHLEMKWKKRKVCEDGIFEEDDKVKRRESGEAKFDGELLEDIVSDWEISDFTGNEVFEHSILEENNKLEACREKTGDLECQVSKDVKTLEKEMNSSSRDETVFDDQMV